MDEIRLRIIDLQIYELKMQIACIDEAIQALNDELEIAPKPNVVVPFPGKRILLLSLDERDTSLP